MTVQAHPVGQILLTRTLQASAIALLLHWLLHWPLVGPHALGFVFTPALCLYFVFVFVGTWAWGLPILTRLPTLQPMVALTFDDGPSPETTPAILDALDRYQTQATFFMLGEQVRRHPELVRRIVASGHGIGIHGDTHTPFVLLSWARVQAQIARTREAVRQACPDAPDLVWLRPPYGFKTLTLVSLARREGLRLAAWSRDSRDYRDRDATAIARQALSRLHPGAIILLHDGTSNPATAAALPEILRELAARGYQCAALPR